VISPLPQVNNAPVRFPLLNVSELQFESFDLRKVDSNGGNSSGLSIWALVTLATFAGTVRSSRESGLHPPYDAHGSQ
jgi:hypothetical protein